MDVLRRLPATVGVLSHGSVLGAGGSSIVYEGVHMRTHQRVAIKLPLVGKMHQVDFATEAAAYEAACTAGAAVPLMDTAMRPHTQMGRWPVLITPALWGSLLDVPKRLRNNKDTARALQRAAERLLTSIMAKGWLLGDWKAANVAVRHVDVAEGAIWVCPIDFGMVRRRGAEGGTANKRWRHHHQSALRVLHTLGTM